MSICQSVNLSTSLSNYLEICPIYPTDPIDPISPIYQYIYFWRFACADFGDRMYSLVSATKTDSKWSYSYMNTDKISSGPGCLCEMPISRETTKELRIRWRHQGWGTEPESAFGAHFVSVSSCSVTSLWEHSCACKSKWQLWIPH